VRQIGSLFHSRILSHPGLIASLFGVTPTVEQKRLNDLNRDGQVDLFDAIP
jgi:hypothetical protein